MTPQKIYARDNKKNCRLCGTEQKTSKYAKLFGKVGESKKLTDKIKLISGVDIVETDGASDIICRNC